MNQRVGRSSIRLAQPVCVIAGASIVGKKEGEGPLGTLFDMVGEDDLFGCKTWEEAESNLQKDAVYMVMERPDGKRRMCRISSPVICWGSALPLPSVSPLTIFLCLESMAPALPAGKH